MKLFKVTRLDRMMYPFEFIDAIIIASDKNNVIEVLAPKAVVYKVPMPPYPDYRNKLIISQSEALELNTAIDKRNEFLCNIENYDTEWYHDDSRISIVEICNVDFNEPMIVMINNVRI